MKSILVMAYSSISFCLCVGSNNSIFLCSNLSGIQFRNLIHIIIYIQEICGILFRKWICVKLCTKHSSGILRRRLVEREFYPIPLAWNWDTVPWMMRCSRNGEMSFRNGGKAAGMPMVLKKQPPLSMGVVCYGWLTGFEPATTGSTFQGSTVELQPPYWEAIILINYSLSRANYQGLGSKNVSNIF